MTIGGLTDLDLSKAAAVLSCEIAIIKTIIDLEGSREGFLSTYEPLLWFHKDVFSRRTQGAYDRVAPDISHPEPGEFGPSSIQHERLHKAAWLNRNAALMSASWGKFQLMGYNYALAGYFSLQDFVSAMYKSEGEHLLAFVQYLKNLSLDEDLRNKNWEAFAFKYKSPEDRNAYIHKLKEAYQSYAEAGS
ncbi:N-acetylmuramidase domain-containing protein [Niabella sp. 22666]|jgi:hypothetical protein|uniref:N-acetylmuramidase domain-containing protein n=1 Tax=Niabella sp. 22666 TaxID=3453954 RepID=UPI003F8353F5